MSYINYSIFSSDSSAESFDDSSIDYSDDSSNDDTTFNTPKKSSGVSITASLSPGQTIRLKISRGDSCPGAPRRNASQSRCATPKQTGGVKKCPGAPRKPIRISRRLF